MLPLISTPLTLGLFGMPGGWEMIVVLVIGLLVFGRRLPEIGRSLGSSIVEFKRASRESTRTSIPSRESHPRRRPRSTNPPPTPLDTILRLVARRAPIKLDLARPKKTTDARFIHADAAPSHRRIPTPPRPSRRRLYLSALSSSWSSLKYGVPKSGSLPGPPRIPPLLVAPATRIRSPLEPVSSASESSDSASLARPHRQCRR